MVSGAQCVLSVHLPPFHCLVKGSVVMSCIGVGGLPRGAHPPRVPVSGRFVKPCKHKHTSCVKESYRNIEFSDVVRSDLCFLVELARWW